MIYQITCDGVLRQGDILGDVPYIRINNILRDYKVDDEKNFTPDWAYDVEPEYGVLEWAIVLTGSCDMKPNRSILLAPLIAYDKVEEKLTKAAKDDISGIRKGRWPTAHALPPSDTTEYSLTKNYSFVDFKEVFTMRYEFAKLIVSKQENRLRLNSPYSEKLARAFATYIARVGVEIV